MAWARACSPDIEDDKQRPPVMANKWSRGADCATALGPLFWSGVVLDLSLCLSLVGLDWADRLVERARPSTQRESRIWRPDEDCARSQMLVCEIVSDKRKHYFRHFEHVSRIFMTPCAPGAVWAEVDFFYKFILCSCGASCL